MFLRPCPGCHRHVANTEPSCPFCMALLPPAEPRPVLRGRVSRAVVFASATLATAGCGGSRTKTENNMKTTTQADAGVQAEPDAAESTTPDRPIPPPVNKPYGAPPARRRIV